MRRPIPPLLVVAVLLLPACGAGERTVRVTDADGNPLADVEAIVFLEGPVEAGRYVLTDADGVAELTLDGTKTVRFSRPGYRVVRATYPGGPDPVVLPRGIRCVLELPEDLALPPAPFRLAVQIECDDAEALRDVELAADYAEPSDADREPRWLGTFLVPPGKRSVALLLPTSGRFRLDWTAGKPVETESGVRAGTFFACGSTEIVVEDREGEQVFEIELDPAAIADAVGKLR
jgi:hypothetical protein